MLIDPAIHRAALRESGADHVVSSLDEIELASDAARMELR